MYDNKLKDIFELPITINANVIIIEEMVLQIDPNQLQTKNIFSDKWAEADTYENIDTLYKFQSDWFLTLYGFESEDHLATYLSTKKVIVDTGCGLGYKSAWFARLAPHAIVIGIDISDSIYSASENFKNFSNLFFLQADISNTKLKHNTVDFTLCDQVIMHTEFPEKTFEHLANITSVHGEFGCYVYSKKSLPRELVDDYFRMATHKISAEEMWEMSTQLTELGKRLSELNVKFVSPDIPLLGIKGGEYDIQRFIYWNFVKCFWNEELGFDLSKSTNFDWYAPSNAKRFSKEEFIEMVDSNKLSIEFLHEEEACYSGRFKKLVSTAG